MAPLRIEDSPIDFPSLDHCLPNNDPSAITQPGMIQAGTWLLCDAGWTRIDRIVASAGKVVSGRLRRTAPVRLLATLRPRAEAESIEIDLAERCLAFEEAERAFVCGRTLLRHLATLQE